MQEVRDQVGFRFDCTQCGACCQREAGHLFLSALDLRRLAEHLSLSDEEFFLQYCEIVDVRLAQRVSLAAESDGRCVFLDGSRCSVYEQRPLQCRTFPFWSSNVVDAETWNRAGQDCPGINQGRVWPLHEIEQILECSEREPLLDVADT